MKPKNLYLLLCLAGLVLPYSQFVPWLVEQRSLSGFLPAMLANRISAFFVADVLVSALVLIAFMRTERTRRPIADVAAAMRKGDIRTEVVPPGYFKIWFSYGDRFKAQAVVREFVTRFIEINVTEERERTKREGPEFKTMADHKLGENLEVLDPATLPEEPIWPDRLRIALAGLGAGLLLGIVTLWLRRPRDPAPEAAVPSVA